MIEERSIRPRRLNYVRFDDCSVCSDPRRLSPSPSPGCCCCYHEHNKEFVYFKKKYFHFCFHFGLIKEHLIRRAAPSRERNFLIVSSWREVEECCGKFIQINSKLKLWHRFIFMLRSDVVSCNLREFIFVQFMHNFF